VCCSQNASDHSEWKELPMFHLTWSGNAKMENVRFAISAVNISSGYHLTKFLIYFLGLLGIFLIIQLCQIHNQKAALWDAMLSRCTFAFLYWTPLTRPFLAFASASKRLFAWNYSYENVFRLQVHFKVKQTFFLMKGFAGRLVLKRRERATRKWPINVLKPSKSCQKRCEMTIPQKWYRRWTRSN